MGSAFESLTGDVLRWWAARHPAWATAQGFAEHDGRLPDPSTSAHLEETAEARRFLERLEASRGGDPLDREALRAALAWRVFELEDAAAWRRDPDLVRELLDHLLPLVLRRDRTAQARAAALTARLSAAPAFLEKGRGRIRPEEASPLWTRLALESAADAPALLDSLHAAVEAEGAPTSAVRGLDDAVTRARSAIDRHARWLHEEVAGRGKGDAALGRARYRRLLHTRRMPYEPAGALELAEGMLESFQRQLEDAARMVLAEAGRSLTAGNAVETAMGLVRHHHPDRFQHALRACREAIAETRTFVRDASVATVPGVAPLDVVETPAYLRHLVPFAAYVSPPLRAPTGEARGTLLVTPKMDLGAFAPDELRNLAVREAYPGRHLRAWRSRSAGAVRALVDAPDLTEGWVLYASALMGRHGYTADPEGHFVRAREAVGRAVRAVVDVRFHAEGLTAEDAMRRLVEEAHLSREEAEAALKRITVSPGRSFAALAGRATLGAAAERAAEVNLPERAFHDRVLAAGHVPAEVLARHVTGGGFA